MVLLSGFLYFGYYADKMILKAKKSLFSSSANQELLLTKLMQQLNLSGTEFYNNVYFEVSSKYVSKKRLELISLKNGFKPTGNKNCYFIFNPKIILDNRVFKDQLDDFLKTDDTIEIERHLSSPIEIFFKEGGFNLSLLAFRYNPGNHSCYANSTSRWEKEGHQISLISKGLEDGNVLDFQVISHEEKYKPNQSLQFFKGDYVILDKRNQQPFKMIITIEEKATNYQIGARIYKYEDHGTLRFNNNISEMKLVISDKDSNNILTSLKIVTPKMFYAKNNTNLFSSKNSFSVSKSSFLKRKKFHLILHWINKIQSTHSTRVRSEVNISNSILLY